MQQHPVPQNITGFEFKLIGALTLRQFGYLAAAGITDFILYSAKLPIFVVILLGGPISLLALALAFLPINDLPFERWLAAFIKTIYSPNVRVWHREPKVLGFLEPQFSIYLHHQQSFDNAIALSDRSKLERYLNSNKKLRPKATADINEERRLSQLEFSPLEKVPNIYLNPNPANANLGTASAPRFQRMSEIAQGASTPPAEKSE